MRTLIAFFFDRSRAALLTLVLILVAGFTVYRTIPKEADPDVQIPVVYVSITHEGIFARGRRASPDPPHGEGAAGT